MGRPLRLLVVEDNDDDEFLLLRTLKKGGFELDHLRVETAEQMRKALSERQFDLIISDYSLPEFSAPAALAVFQEFNLDIPFVIQSGTVGEETAVAAMRAGASDFITKGNHRLLPAIDRELREAEGRRTHRSAEQRFRSLIENALDIITVVDAEGRIKFASPSLQTVLGYHPQERVGVAFFDLIHPEDLPAVKQSFAHVLAHPETPTTVEFRYQHKNGTWRVLEAIGKNMLDDVPEGIVVNSRDVTERKQAEEGLRRALEELRKTQEQMIRQERLRALGEMASGIAHDFNNALSSVLGFSETLLMYPDVLNDREQATDFLKMIVTAAQDAASVVDRLSEFYRHRESSDNLGPLNLARLAEQTVNLTQPRWKGQAQSEGVTIGVDLQLQEVPDVTGDEQQLRQALTNLIFNAVDAMKPGGGTLRLATRPDGDTVVLEIGDTGSGMSEETRNRCLEPFFTTKGKKGTGMGLSMVYGIVRRHQGTIDIDTELGRGTTFILRFPLQLAEASVETEETPLSTHTPALRVLVVESDPLVARVISTFLTSDGHTAECLNDGAAALERFREAEGDFDLVIAAHVVPGMSGEQLAQAVKEHCPDKPFILLSSFASGEATPAGVERVLTKPITIEAFRRAVSSVFSPEAMSV